MTINNRIHSLPLHLANQIAAGEVIDRPASIIKELVENSIDAGASQIDISIEGAGSKLIRVHDNGFGIHTDDLLLAVSRHATSKLSSSEQLSQISSLGFRGEALPSIASVSRLTLSSRQKNSDTGWELNGTNNELIPISHPLGTTVEVRDLFFNIPARRRFLRSDKTEQHHILTTIHRLALSQFEIGFQYTLSSNSAKLPAATTPAQQQKRLAKICGKTFVDNCLFIQQKYNEIELHGWLGKASAHRSQTDVQYFFINGRIIRDRVTMHAIRQAYGNLIPNGRQPAYVLYLTIPLDRVDINVHPTKHEVRFRDARLIHGLITSALQEALLQPVILEKNAPYLDQGLIAEQANTYQTGNHQQQFSTPAVANTAPLSNNIILHQRYIIVHDSNQPLLIDLQQAEYQWHQQQLLAAINSNTLKSRPILVPISVEIGNDAIALVNRHSAMLSTLSIDLTLNGHQLTVKSIPTLLSHVNAQHLMVTILSALTAKQTTIQQLLPILQQQISLIPVTHSAQAEQILQKIGTDYEKKSWCTQLDQKTLSSLFSS